MTTNMVRRGENPGRLTGFLRRRGTFGWVFRCLTPFLLGAISATAGTVAYSVTYLGAFGTVCCAGGPWAWHGPAINASGQVAGTYGSHAVLYSNGVLTDLGTLGGDTSYGVAINDLGEVTGTSDTAEIGRFGNTVSAFLYSNGVMTSLGEVGEGEYSYGMAINDYSQVAGFGAGDNECTWCYVGFVYSNGVMNGVGGVGTYVLGINDSGQITGMSGDRPFFPNSGSGTILSGNGAGKAINASGEVTGVIELPDYRQSAFLYSNGVMILLGGENSIGEAINSSGQVTGTAQFTDTTRYAFLYSDGVMTDLNTLVAPTPNSNFTHLYNATGINDRGQIVAVGDGGTYLLDPLNAPEPSTFTVFAAGMLALIGAGRRCRVHR